MNIDLLEQVPGGRELVEWFGYAPRFHDAEVLGVALDREEPSCSIRVHVFEMTREVDASGHFVCTKHAVVTFTLRELTELELDGFNHQNAVMEISVERGPDKRFRMVIEPAYGLGGLIEGRTLEIAIQPGVPAGSQYFGPGS